LPFVKVGGSFISMKGPDVSEEVKEATGAINKLGGEILNSKVYNLPDSDINHSVITIKKIRQTPSTYPRKAGKPSKEPLK
jgi:16S rRNA (guanine527-N7)-methyltransferase